MAKKNIIKETKKLVDVQGDEFHEMLPTKKKIFNIVVKYGRAFLCFISRNIERILKGVTDGIIGVVTLRNSGKWISVLVITVVLYLNWKFLKTQNYSIESFTLAKDGLVTLGSLVFSVIGGVRGATTIIDKVGNVLEKKNGTNPPPEAM